MTKQLRVRHSNKEHVRELFRMLSDVIECYREGYNLSHPLIAKIDGNDWIDLKRSAVAYAKTYGLGSSLFWWARNIANDPIVPWDFKSLSKHGARSAVWTSA